MVIILRHKNTFTGALWSSDECGPSFSFNLPLDCLFVLHAAKQCHCIYIAYQQFPWAAYLDSTTLFKVLLLLQRYWTGCRYHRYGWVHCCLRSKFAKRGVSIILFVSLIWGMKTHESSLLIQWSRRTEIKYLSRPPLVSFNRMWHALETLCDGGTAYSMYCNMAVSL